MRTAWVMLASIVCATGCSATTPAGDAGDVPMTDAPPADVAPDAPAVNCVGGPCPAGQVCVQLCGGGADSGSSGLSYTCMPALPACQQHACTCDDGYCGAQSYACGRRYMGLVICTCA